MLAALVLGVGKTQTQAVWSVYRLTLYWLKQLRHLWSTYGAFTARFGKYQLTNKFMLS